MNQVSNKACVEINGKPHDVIVGRQESLNKKIQELCRTLGLRFSDVNILVPNFPSTGRQLIKRPGSVQINAVITKQ